jgi:nitrite reductase (NADH) small subunit
MSVDTLAVDTPAAQTPAGVRIRWTAVCPYGRLEPEGGVAALVGGAQVAIFRTADGQLHAVGHRDPISGAHVMSRGIVGIRDGAPTVTSPVHRHVYDLRSGECLDVPGVRVPVYPVRCPAGVVEVGLYAVEVGTVAVEVGTVAVEVGTVAVDDLRSPVAHAVDRAG